MSIKFQYNKTSLQDLRKHLVVREKALPTLKNKESALRIEVKKAKDAFEAKVKELENSLSQHESMIRLWNEFDTSFLQIDDVILSSKKIAGTKIPLLNKINFSVREFSSSVHHRWLLDGIHVLQQLSTLGIEQEILNKTVEILYYARRKTTQKVNLYEKVQIPGYKEAIRKIKRFLEDEDNLSKSSQKIIKKRQETIEEEKS